MLMPAFSYSDEDAQLYITAKKAWKGAMICNKNYRA